MPSKSEKKRRAALAQTIVEKETKKAIAAMPISFHDLAALFDHLNLLLGREGCNHTPNITIKFLESKKLNQDKILPWLQEQGGYCDCEILANVEENWESEIEKNLQGKSMLPIQENNLKSDDEWHFLKLLLLEIKYSGFEKGIKKYVNLPLSLKESVVAQSAKKYLDTKNVDALDNAAKYLTQQSSLSDAWLYLERL